MSGTTKAVEESATPPASAKKDGGRVRSIASWALVVIGSILVPVAVVAFWGQRTITDAERYIDTVGPLAAEEAIKTAIINKTTESLENALQENQATSQLLDALPPEAAAKLSAPIEDRIFIAGEATALDFYGTAHGAWMEGERAADAALTAQALKGLGLDPRRPGDDSEA